ncbi:hypothetical protein RLEG12_25840 [Rhizobium leguminosarum bv. trifolii CB782]|nr:hypothetical protein RLEG12_25840 [Rhizobium leguminosarum bv. trifolii CB782]
MADRASHKQWERECAASVRRRLGFLALLFHLDIPLIAAGIALLALLGVLVSGALLKRFPAPASALA